ncbi:MAG: acylphosphatase [Mycobacteriaceae bacterium]
MTSPPAERLPTARLTAWVHGQVQGVGFRWWVRSRALERDLVGHATNHPDGRVLIIAQGSRAHCEELLALLRSGASPGVVRLVVESFSEPRSGLIGFTER